MLKIGLDLRPTEAGFKSHAGRGTGRYTEELTSELQRIAADGADLEGIALTAISSASLEVALWEKQLLKLLPFGKRTFESQVLYPRRVARTEADIIHFFSHGDASARSIMPQIVSVLDLIPLRFPELYKANKSNLRFKFARYLEFQSIKRALGLIAISEATKRDLIEILGVRGDDVVVTPLAVSDEFSALSRTEGNWREQQFALRWALGIPIENPLLLYVGGIDPRKNVGFLLEVFAEVLREATTEKKPILLLAGNLKRDDQYPKFQQTIKRLGVADSVHELGFVSDEQLPLLYQAADLFVFPSLYEGFGFPVLESMACGTPVIAGDNSSIPEVAGRNSALLLPDMEQTAWVRAILEVLTSPERQISLSNAGIEQAKLFSWTKI